MRFRQRHREDIDINVTPLIDVVLLLLIFFMVSTKFIEQSKIDLVLPSASRETPDKLPATIEITIDRRGQVFVEGKALVNSKLDTLRQALAGAKSEKGGRAEPVVVINADRGTAFQLAVDAMDAARLEGLTHVTFPMNVRDRRE
ncbi:MAG: biopolymer transporter ExbD [Gammaproteobacteria bacterium]|nr:biopolymer transporter ExbD [Gammaproteobacteria bacterium]